MPIAAPPAHLRAPPAVDAEERPREADVAPLDVRVVEVAAADVPAVDVPVVAVAVPCARLRTTGALTTPGTVEDDPKLFSDRIGDDWLADGRPRADGADAPCDGAVGGAASRRAWSSGIW